MARHRMVLVVTEQAPDQLAKLSGTGWQEDHSGEPREQHSPAGSEHMALSWVSLAHSTCWMMPIIWQILRRGISDINNRLDQLWVSTLVKCIVEISIQNLSKQHNIAFKWKGTEKHASLFIFHFSAIYSVFRNSNSTKMH